MAAEPFSRLLPLSRLTRHGVPVHLAADPAQCAALAERFGLESIDQLSADLHVRRTGEGPRTGAEARGRLTASVVQACVVSGDPVPARIDQAVTLSFAPAPPADAADIELAAEEADTILIEGDRIDLGEAVAQALLLALDPWPRADEATLAEARRRLLSEEEAAAQQAEARTATNPFSVLRSPDRKA